MQDDSRMNECNHKQLIQLIYGLNSCELNLIELDEYVYCGRQFLLPKNLYNKNVYFKILLLISSSQVRLGH